MTRPCCWQTLLKGPRNSSPGSTRPIRVTVATRPAPKSSADTLEKASHLWSAANGNPEAKVCRWVCGCGQRFKRGERRRFCRSMPAPEDLPERHSAEASGCGAAGGTLVPALTEADPANPAHTPPIFGRAAINLPEWPTVLVFSALAVSLTVVPVDSFRRGALLFEMSMALSAFFLRLVLNDRRS